MLDVGFYYIMPSFRGANLEKKILRYLEGFADANQTPIYFQLYTGDRIEAKERMMKMAGWQYVGGHFLRVPEDGQGNKNYKDNETDTQMA